MGWANGSKIVRAVVDGMNDAGVTKAQRPFIFRRLVLALRDEDWDTEDEIAGLDESLDFIIEGLDNVDCCS